MHTIPTTGSINVMFAKPVKLVNYVYLDLDVVALADFPDHVYMPDGIAVNYPASVTGFTIDLVRGAIYQVVMHYTGDALIDPESDLIDQVAWQINGMLAAFGVDSAACDIRIAAESEDQLGMGNLVFDAMTGDWQTPYITQMMAIPGATVTID